MLAARGVSLGLGKINLSDLNQLPGDKFRSAQLAQLKQQQKKSRPRVIIKKKADAKTVWAACRAVIVGCIVISVGFLMTVLGYFDKQFSERVTIQNGVEKVYHDAVVRIHLKTMQYVGPVLMGLGSFILIIACVVTLESRDKHAQVITEESINSKKKRRQMSLAVEAQKQSMLKDGGTIEEQTADNEDDAKRRSHASSTISTTAEVHHPKRASTGTAPLADVDSLDLHSCSSEVALTTERDRQDGLVYSNED